jgi:hypothetical protein
MIAVVDYHEPSAGANPIADRVRFLGTGATVATTGQ